MGVNLSAYQSLMQELQPFGAALVAVSKVQPLSSILELYAAGHRDFGENYVQELVAKQEALPQDIRWHFIGHLQRNKVKAIAPFVHLIHGVDSLKLLEEIGRQGEKLGRAIPVLLQVHIAAEETKFGFDEGGLQKVLFAWKERPMGGVQLKGLMGMASFTEDEAQVRSEFSMLSNLFRKGREWAGADWDTLSMGMSGDYSIALVEGATLIRVGSRLFGARPKAV